MVRKSNTKRIVGAGGDPTDGRDPAYQDLYIPRKEGDSTGSSQEVNDLASGLSAPGGENAAFANAIDQQTGRPISLRENTRFPSEPNTTGITNGAGAGPADARPTTSFTDWIDGAVSKYRHPILTEIQKQVQAPVVQNPKDKFRLTENPASDYA